MAIKRVGHVVLKMRDLDKAKQFYVDFLGMTIGNEKPGAGMFLRFNDYHHDIAIFKTGDDAESPKENQVGLVHVALVCDGDATVRGYYDRAKEMGIEIEGWTDHDITHSLYLRDPEGNLIELYAETGYDWQNNGMGFRSREFDIEGVPAPAAL
jgi:catechol 2,3-dioxygenase